MRATAATTRIITDAPYMDGDGWTYTVSRLVASQVSSPVALEYWWSQPNDRHPVVGRVRIRRPTPDLNPGQVTQLYELAGLVDSTIEVPKIVELLNVELEPAFLGQGLGRDLIRAALKEVPPNHLVVCEPVATQFSNVDPPISDAAVRAFYTGLGMRPDTRASGFLTGLRGALRL